MTVATRRRARGFTLLELMLALALGALVLAGLLLLIQSTLQSIRAQQALAGVQATVRFAMRELGSEIEGAGYIDSPWSEGSPDALSGSVDAATVHGDRLVLRRWSRRNCLGNDNPVRDATGAPTTWLRQSDFSLRDGWRLVKTCHYGPGPGPGTRQLNAATLVEGVEAFQVQFAEDRDGDGLAEHWVEAGNWADEGQVLGARIALLVASAAPVQARAVATFDLLGHRVRPADDGRLRLQALVTIPVRGRLP